MTDDLARYREFCERFLDDGNEGRWTLTGRDYVTEHIWRPLIGYRTMPAKGYTSEDLCAPCRALIGNVETAERHAHPFGHDPDCPGAVRKPLVITAVNLPRRNAKTHSILSFAIATAFLKRNQRWAFVAAAKDQADELLTTKLLRPLRKHPELTPWWTYIAADNKIAIPGKNSWIEVLPTSFGSITGRGYTGVLVDEARDVPAAVAAKLAPSIFDCHGVECPKGHGHWQVPEPGSGGTPPPTKCPTCGAPPERWFGRLLFASSSGLITDNPDKDWFANFVEKRLERPHGSVYVFATGKILNPSVSTEIVDAVAEAFADVEGINTHIAVETTNQSIRSGDAYLTRPQMEAVVDKRLLDCDESDRLAVWFLDVSEKHDLTTLAVVCDDAIEKEAAFSRVVLQHVRIWDPKDRRTCPAGVVDDSVVEAYLDYIYGRFPKLRRSTIDTRGSTWAALMMERGRAANKPWRRRCEAYVGKTPDDDAAYDCLRDMVFDRRIRLPNDPKLLGELLALKTVQRRYGGSGVVDPNANAQGRNRNRAGLHRDISMAVSGACFLALIERKKALNAEGGATAQKANESRALRNLKPVFQGKGRER